MINVNYEYSAQRPRLCAARRRSPESRGGKLNKVTEVENIFCSSSVILKLEQKLNRIYVVENIFGSLVAQNRLLSAVILRVDHRKVRSGKVYSI